ncbi:MAG: mechanosensitive ion channel [Schleiferiaceae bacterium]|nr:mechanosensitive ion channel [Schleiferiaceae bacterium]
MEEIIGVSMETIMENALVWAKQGIIALLILWIGMRIVRVILKGFKKAMSLRDLDASLTTFLESLMKITLQAFVIIATINQLGVATTSIVAVLGAAGLAVGMALSGTLQNFAGGAMILMFKPFKVGDFIETKGFSGTVKSIQIFVTTLTTLDNKLIIIPNGILSNGSLINYSAQDYRRLEWTVGLNVDVDLEYAKLSVRKLLEDESRVSKDKPILVELDNVSSSVIKLTVRVWVQSSDFKDVYYSLNDTLYKESKNIGIISIEA